MGDASPKYNLLVSSTFLRACLLEKKRRKELLEFLSVDTLPREDDEFREIVMLPLLSGQQPPM